MNILHVIGSDADRETAKRSFDRALSGEHFTTEEAYGDETLARLFGRIFWSPIRNESGDIIGVTCFNMNGNLDLCWKHHFLSNLGLQLGRSPYMDKRQRIHL
jgi:hypothetical protein